MHPEQFLKGNLQTTQIEESRARQRVDENVEIAALGIPSAQYRVVHARVACARLLDETPNLISMERECAGLFHADYLGFDFFRFYAQMADSGPDPIEP
jgi:hypothetical protein